MDKFDIHPSVFIQDNTVIRGTVAIGQRSSVQYNAIIRGDLAKVIIGEYVNIQDGAIIHVDEGCPVIIEDYTTIGHGAIIHGCTIGSNCMIGMGAVILNGAKIGSTCIISAGAVVGGRTKIPDNSLYVGNPGKIIRNVSALESRDIKKAAERAADQVGRL